MGRTHYETLGLSPAATQAQVRSAYRRLVLRHHPDRSDDPASKALFLAASQAYETLSDPERRAAYDASLAYARAQQSRREEAARPKHEPPAPEPPKPADLGPDLARLGALFNRGRYAEAETLAQDILRRSPRQAVPYAVLGDIARARGQMDEAQRMAAYAAQMDPGNPTYQRRYEQLLAGGVTHLAGQRTRFESEAPKPAMLSVAGSAAVAAAVYLALSPEASVLGPLGIVSSWTIGTLVLLFLCGVATGVSMSVGNWIERFDVASTTATGKPGPAVALGLVAIANFWAAALLYAVIGVAQRAFDVSTTRLVLAVGAVCGVLALGAGLGGAVSGGQVLLWGGNLTYLGAIVGWLVADSFR